MSQATSRKMLTSPLSPGLLEPNGMLPPGWDTLEDSVDADGWSAYWITTNHGWNHGNDAGILRIAASDDGGVRKVRIKSHIALLGGLEHRISAEMESDPTPLNQLRRWAMRSETTGPDGEARDNLTLDRSAERNEQGQWFETIADHTFSRKWPTVLCGDWALMDAATRVTDTASPPEASFTLLDNFTAIKTEQQWRALPEAHRNDSVHGVALRGFYQRGRGMVSREFWLDDNDALAMVIDYNRVLVRDPNAPARYEALLNSYRNSDAV